MTDKNIRNNKVTTDVTVGDLIDSLAYMMDGVSDHDIKSMTGFSDDVVNRIINVRNKTSSLVKW